MAWDGLLFSGTDLKCRSVSLLWIQAACGYLVHPLSYIDSSIKIVYFNLCFLYTLKFVALPSPRRWATQQASLPTWQKKLWGKRNFWFFHSAGSIRILVDRGSISDICRFIELLLLPGTGRNIFRPWRRTVSNFWLETVIPSLRSSWQIGRLSFFCWCFLKS